jgi:hypothetical protein
MSEIRANSITDAAGTGAPDFPNGLTNNGALTVSETTLQTFANGDAGRPRIFGEAMVRPSNGLSILTVSAASTYTISLGLTAVIGTVSTTSAGTEVVSYTGTIVLYSGTIRFNCSHLNSGGWYSTLSLYKNGVLVTSFVTTSTSPVARSVDVSVVPNDVIEWRHLTSTSGTASQVSARSETASDAYVDQIVYKRAST